MNCPQYYPVSNYPYVPAYPTRVRNKTSYYDNCHNSPFFGQPPCNIMPSYYHPPPSYYPTYHQHQPDHMHPPPPPPPPSSNEDNEQPPHYHHSHLPHVPYHSHMHYNPYYDTCNTNQCNHEHQEEESQECDSIPIDNALDEDESIVSYIVPQDCDENSELSHHHEDTDDDSNECSEQEVRTKNVYVIQVPKNKSSNFHIA